MNSITLAVTIAAIAVIASCGPAAKQGAKPPEPGKLKGHQKPYVVNGERYEPLRTSEGFVQNGIASWYGPDFHGKKTSNGEIYDMHAMTAAHKTLPLGVFVKVENKSNGRETVVRVNDRGPFVKGRVIDLSYAAAQKLGVVQSGTAPVRIEALGRRTAGTDGSETYEPVDYDRGSFAVQIGSFAVRENAERLAADLRAKHGNAAIERAHVKGETFYRVHAGRYASLRAAEEARERFERSGHPGSFVVSLD